MPRIYVLDSSVAITADRASALIHQDCLIDLLLDLHENQLLIAPPSVVKEVCGEQGEQCVSTKCRQLCSRLRQRRHRGPPLERLGELTQQYMLIYGLDIGEAEALSLAYLLATGSPGTEAVVLTGDSAARSAAKQLRSTGVRIRVHGDLYMVELAKKLGYCSPREAAALAQQLPRLKRYINKSMIIIIIEKILRQQGKK